MQGLLPELGSATRILVVGGGKAGAGMAAGLEAGLGTELPKVVGVLNVPAGEVADLRRIRLHHARPIGFNFPTTEGVAGVTEMLTLLRSAGPDDVAICLLSGGGSALLPMPAAGITLEDKLAITQSLCRAGATIVELNTVRKHLSAVKGGRLAEAFQGHRLISLIISDVVGNPLDVIASGPTVPDPTTYTDALHILDRYGIVAPSSVVSQLRLGVAGGVPETLKSLPHNVENRLIGFNDLAVEAAKHAAQSLGYSVETGGTDNTGEASVYAERLARQIAQWRGGRPACIVSGGETTVTLGQNPGKGGRNQELVLATILALGERRMDGVCILSAGTDGEDGPTDAAGAVATFDTVCAMSGFDPADHLARHDAYPLFDHAGGLLRTGLTGTNVMDLQVVLLT